MKRIVLLALLFVTMISHAQEIYTKITKYDKFDDVVSEKVIKTILTKTDSTFIIETKGKKPIVYRFIETPGLAFHIGRKDSLVNLVADVYGFQDNYELITEELYNEVIAEVREKQQKLAQNESIDSLLQTDSLFQKIYKLSLYCIILSKKTPTLTIRTISKYKYLYEYKTDLFWIRFKDGSRIIYTKD